MNPKELVEMMSTITERGKETLQNYIQNASNLSHKDRGVEGWFQTELIAELQKKGETVKHVYSGPDIIFDEGMEVELKTTTCFNPGWTIDGMINHKAPVLFFSGYLPYYQKKNPDFENEDAVKEWFVDRLTEKKKEKMKKHFGQTGLNIMYKTVDLGNEKGIVGFVKPSKDISCVKI